MPFYYVFIHQNIMSQCVSLMFPKFLENLCMVDSQKIFVEKMSDCNMKCMETPQGSPNTGTGDSRCGFQDEMVVRLGSFCLADPTTRSCCDLVLLLGVSLWPSETCWVQPVIILSWMVVAPVSHFLGFQGMWWWCSDTGFSVEVSEEWLIWSKAMYFTEVRESLSALFRERIYP